jgi:Predicted membrane protein
MNASNSDFSRIASIDIVRGFVMVIMALDHVRDLMHVDSLTQDPTNLATTTPALFFTRWITHLCAPTFVFLAGTSAYLSILKTKDNKTSSRFLISRGLWLILLEFTIVNFGIWFDIQFRVWLFQVIAAIGLGFIVLGAAIRLPSTVLGLGGLMMVCLHNLLPPSIPLFAVNAIPLGQETTLVIGYPPLPWLGIMLLGYGFGNYLVKSENREKLVLRLGIACLLIFAILRATNFYGDPSPWSTQKNTWLAVISFLNVTKYPPSLLFSLLMLGTMFLLLGLAEHLKGRIPRLLIVYGRVPLFYYLLHWYVVHLTLFAVLFIQGFHSNDFVFGFRFGRPEAPSGLSLGGVYLVWAGIVCAIYPVCRWFCRYKYQNRNSRWVRYM